MKKILLFSLSFVLSVFAYSQTDEQPAGSGTQADPYQIANLNNLYWMSLHNSNDMHYIQTADIDASSTSSWSSGEGFSPISGFRACSYDGQNHTINGLYINRTSYGVGLFAYIYEGSIIKNLGVINANISSTRYGVGIIVAGTHTSTDGSTDHTTSIINCYATGTITGEYNVGGIAGGNDYYSLIKNCYTDVTINGTDYTQGGLAGNNNHHSSIINCHSSGTITGTYNIGGLVGKNQNESYIDSCYSSANVSNQINTLRGGFVGKNDNATIKNSFCTGNVQGDNTVGGFVGQNYNSGIIENCYSFGNAEGSSKIGGFCGYNSNSSIANCYSIGNITGTSDTGGFVGKINAGSSTSQCFWNTDSSSQSISPAGIGKTTSQMKNMCTFFDGNEANWDFINETQNGTDDIWGMNASENNGYPFLNFQNYQHTESCCSGSDTIKPTILSSHLDKILYVDTSCYFVFLPNYTTDVVASDNCSPTDSLIISQAPAAGSLVSDTSVTLFVTDLAGNTDSVNFNITVIDSIKPVIYCVDNQTVMISENDTFYTVSGNEFNPDSIWDNCSIDSIVNNFNNDSTLNNAHIPAGTTTIVWTATDGNGNTTSCSFNVTVNIAFGLNDISNNISIYPNPTSNIINIRSDVEITNIVITDITGKILHQSNTDKSFDISEMDAGIYLVKVQTKDNILIEKIIKK